MHNFFSQLRLGLENHCISVNFYIGIFADKNLAPDVKSHDSVDDAQNRKVKKLRSDRAVPRKKRTRHSPLPSESDDFDFENKSKF